MQTFLFVGVSYFIQKYCFLWSSTFIKYFFPQKLNANTSSAFNLLVYTAFNHDALFAIANHRKWKMCWNGLRRNNNVRCKENLKPTFCGCFSHLFNTKKVLFIFIGVIVDQNVIITWNQHTHRFTAVELDRIVLFLLFFFSWIYVVRVKPCLCLCLSMLFMEITSQVCFRLLTIFSFFTCLLLLVLQCVFSLFSLFISVCFEIFY